MHVILLGTAAGGGFPQWNCWCPTCRAVRTDPGVADTRTQSSAAVSADGEHWFLLNASPDVRDQLRHLPASPTGARFVPFEGVLVTDAELDHSLGLALLREARYLPLYATATVEQVLAEDSRILAVTRAFAEVPVTRLAVGVETPLRHRDGMASGLVVEPFLVPAGPPRFARVHAEDHTIGVMITETATGARCAFVPGCGGLDASLTARLATADLLLFDGTFWRDDEMITLGLSDRTARQMDHLPIGGPDGSLQALAALPCRTMVYTHINNTNPMLLHASLERGEVEQHGMMIGMDGMRFEVHAPVATAAPLKGLS